MNAGIIKMSEGRVKYAFYNNGGKFKKGGLRNKRKAYWANIRRKEQIRLENIERAAEIAEREWENQFDFFAQVSESMSD